MQGMRLRAAGIVALVVVISMIAAAVAPCLPGAMVTTSSRPDEHMACGQQNDSVDRISASAPDCCKSIEPAVLTETESLKPPVRDRLHWVSSTTELTSPSVAGSMTAPVSPSLSDAIVAAAPPRYVLLRTFLI